MSRENAIKFLREISMGIEYLENSYANRAQNDQNVNTVRRVNLFELVSFGLLLIQFNVKETSTTTFNPTTPITIKTTSPPIQKEIHNSPSLLKMNEISKEKAKGKIKDISQRC